MQEIVAVDVVRLDERLDMSQRSLGCIVLLSLLDRLLEVASSENSKG